MRLLGSSPLIARTLSQYQQAQSEYDCPYFSAYILHVHANAMLSLSSSILSGWSSRVPVFLMLAGAYVFGLSMCVCQAKSTSRVGTTRRPGLSATTSRKRPYFFRSLSRISLLC